MYLFTQNNFNDNFISLKFKAAENFYVYIYIFFVALSCFQFQNYQKKNKIWKTCAHQPTTKYGTIKF